MRSIPRFILPPVAALWLCCAGTVSVPAAEKSSSAVTWRSICRKASSTVSRGPVIFCPRLRRYASRTFLSSLPTGQPTCHFLITTINITFAVTCQALRGRRSAAVPYPSACPASALPRPAHPANGALVVTSKSFCVSRSCLKRRLHATESFHMAVPWGWTKTRGPWPGCPEAGS